MKSFFRKLWLLGILYFIFIFLIARIKIFQDIYNQIVWGTLGLIASFVFLYNLKNPEKVLNYYRAIYPPGSTAYKLFASRVTKQVVIVISIFGLFFSVLIAIFGALGYL